MARFGRREFLVKLASTAAVGASLGTRADEPLHAHAESAIWGWDGEDMVVNVKDDRGGTWVWSSRPNGHAGPGKQSVMMPTLLGPVGGRAMPVSCPTVSDWTKTILCCFGSGKRRAFASCNHYMVVLCDEDGVRLADFGGSRRCLRLRAGRLGPRTAQWYWEET